MNTKLQSMMMNLPIFRPDGEVSRKARWVKHSALAFSLMAALLVALTGCGTGKGAANKKEDFFTSGSREADQRATQRMAKEEQLSGTSSGTEEKKVKKAQPPTEGTAGTPKAAQVEGKMSLFDRLGGEQGLTTIVADFLDRATQDPRINWPRKGVKHGSFFHREQSSEVWTPNPEAMDNLKIHFVQFLALATGGPAKYDGKEIKTAHAGMRISNPEFDAAIGDLKASLDKLQVPNKEQKELLSIIESTRPEVVTER